MANKKTITAGEGKIWRSLLDGTLLSKTIILGSEDSASNYEEVDESLLEGEPGDPPDGD